MSSASSELITLLSPNLGIALPSLTDFHIQNFTASQ
jgi:hypothetical protein